MAPDEDARLVYASDSISDVLGYDSSEVVGNSLFNYFHPDEIPFAQSFHGRGVQMDKAAVLAYCRLKSKSGEYICCECVFTVVYSVIVASTSVYRQTNKSHERALKAPVIRRAFSSSQRDPRYHMLAHLSPKFSTPPAGSHEPRAALILNRFTRTLTILYATHALGEILNFNPQEAVGMSFFEFISQGCLQDAVEALERAKENDSIAYLRFYCRDPRVQDVGLSGDRDDLFRRSTLSRSSTSRGWQQSQADENRGNGPTRRRTPEAENGDADNVMTSDGEDDDDENYSRTSYSTSRTSMSNSAPPQNRGPEVEAVVSCTSDGLVVVVRRARPMIPVLDPHASHLGFFASSPWARTPFHPPTQTLNGGGPASADFMDSIRQVAVFAWCLRSINENMVQYARTEPEGDFKLTPPRKKAAHDGSEKTDGYYETFDVDDGNEERPTDLTGIESENSPKSKQIIEEDAARNRKKRKRSVT